MATDFLGRIKEFLEVTERKFGIFLVLFVVSFSIYGPFFGRVVPFFVFVFYTYVFSSFIDRKIEERIEKGLNISAQQIAFYGVVYLVSVFVVVFLMMQ